MLSSCFTWTAQTGQSTLRGDNHSASQLLVNRTEKTGLRHLRGWNGAQYANPSPPETTAPLTHTVAGQAITVAKAQHFLLFLRSETGLTHGHCRSPYRQRQRNPRHGVNFPCCPLSARILVDRAMTAGKPQQLSVATRAAAAAPNEQRTRVQEF